jgi:predicted phosphodiesterase
MMTTGSFDEALEVVYRLGETRAAMSAESRRFVESWPQTLHVSRAGRRMVMVHGSVEDPINGYVYEDSVLGDIDPLEPTTVLMGATHRPFVRSIGNTTYINVGSCGLPRDRGDLGCAVLYEPSTNTVDVKRFSIREETRAALDRVGRVNSVVTRTFARRGAFKGDLV